jgi:NRAMP (natural resistance-associated macrophage protein)-like metal ion transporter
VQANLSRLNAPLTSSESAEKRLKFLRKAGELFGPGLITGAADDDPSGIGTYAVAGAQFGTALLWTALLTWPLMAPVQMMCARIGICSQRGLAGAFLAKFPRPVVLTTVLLLTIVNTITVGADLSAMADAAEMLTRINSHYYILLFGGFTAYATIRLRYFQLSSALKWFALSLLAYVITAFLLQPKWSLILHNAFIPHWPTGAHGWSTLVAVLGTTISPYLFFWQAAQEQEERQNPVPRMVIRPNHQTLRVRALDIGVGTFYSNLVMFFVILTTALTLHVNGVTNLNTTQEVSRALRPLAGSFATGLFTLGLVAVGLLAIPTLTGSAAYAIAETMKWRHGLHHEFAAARPFYGVIIVSTVIGIILDFQDVSPVQALYWASVLNGLLAPFLLIAMVVVASDRRIMHDQCSSLLARTVVSVAALLMLGVAVAMFVF